MYVCLFIYLSVCLSLNLALTLPLIHILFSENCFPKIQRTKGTCSPGFKTCCKQVLLFILACSINQKFYFFVGLKMAILMGSIHRSVFTIVNRQSISMKTRTSTSTLTTTTSAAITAPTPTKYVKFDKSGNILTRVHVQWGSEIQTRLDF